MRTMLSGNRLQSQGNGGGSGQCGKLTRSLSLFLLLTLLLTNARVLHAAPFQNLDFEQAAIQNAPANFVPWDAFAPISVAAAVPNWTVMEDTSVCNAIWGLPGALDETAVSLVSKNSPFPPIPSGTPIQGNFSIELSSDNQGVPGGPGVYFSTASISQTGDIPADAKTLLFYIRPLFAGNHVFPGPVVTVNGTPIDVSIVSTSSNIWLMGGDISPFAGTTNQLTFSAIGALDFSGIATNESDYDLDDISFSSSPAPEPASLALLLAAAVPLLANRSRRR